MIYYTQYRRHLNQRIVLWKLSFWIFRSRWLIVVVDASFFMLLCSLEAVTSDGCIMEFVGSFIPDSKQQNKKQKKGRIQLCQHVHLSISVSSWWIRRLHSDWLVRSPTLRTLLLRRNLSVSVFHLFRRIVTGILVFLFVRALATSILLARTSRQSKKWVASL